MNDTTLLCTIYRCKREKELYLYVDRREGTARVPQELLDSMGSLSEVMTIRLESTRKLARAKAPEVLAAIQQEGYYLQLPPDKQALRFTQGE